MSKSKITRFFILLLCAGLITYYFYPENTLPADAKIDSIVVHKSDRKLSLYSNGVLIKSYKISLGREPMGHKEFEGDRKTPEGFYYINDKNPNSGYHKNLGISYPNQDDLNLAAALGKSAGGDIKIHGLRNWTGFIGKFHRWCDWTMGCIAVTNSEMDELYHAVDIGTEIEIKP